MGGSSSMPEMSEVAFTLTPALSLKGEGGFRNPPRPFGERGA